MTFILHFSSSRYDRFLIEYARYLPFGLAVASTFLQDLHSPNTERLKFDFKIENTIKSIFEQGGEVVNNELRSIIIDIYNLHKQLNLDLKGM